MLTVACQRWRAGRSAYRPAGEPIETKRYEVAPMPRDRDAKDFVVAHHYSGSFPAARERVGLYRGADLVGVAVFSVPAQPRCLHCVPGDDASRVELGRFVLLDDVPSNGESWFLARCFEHLRAEGYTGVVAFSDPAPRTTSAGEIIFPGHVGTIYQATNAAYLGRSKAEVRRVLPDGTLVHGRALAKIRRRDQGYRYAAQRLVEHGATPLSEDEDAVAWVARWCTALTRPLRHPGNHKYAWALEHSRAQRSLPTHPYPKWSHAA